MKDMDDLHLPRGADAVDVDHASLHDEEALARLSFAEEILVFLQISHRGKRADLSDVGIREPCKDSRAEQCICNDEGFVTRSLRHGQGERPKQFNDWLI